ncbi:MAG: hydrolase [Parachlamydiales bacterium]|jgi:glutamate carboxypeptidase
MPIPKEYSTYLDWIDTQQHMMEELLIKLADQNSGSDNLEGLSHVHQILLDATADLRGERSTLELPLTPELHTNGETTLKKNANALLIRRYPKAPLRILLGGHMDTVFPKSSPFQKCRLAAPDKIIGPGTADMKGGLIVMIYALKALERSPLAGKIGWDILITPDEETGSVASQSLWRQYAWQNHFGLIFEPAMPGGTIVTERKGSINYIASARGQKAHAGRDFNKGKNAVVALAEWITAIYPLNTETTTLNVGVLMGGEAANVVPDYAQSYINVRSPSLTSMKKAEKGMLEAAQKIKEKYDIAIELQIRSRRPPKPFDQATANLLQRLQECASTLQIPLETAKTGGVCDGNNLAAEGLPTLDTLGVIGGGLHTDEEWAWLPSLSQRAKLSAALLLSLASDAPSIEFIAEKHIQKHPGTDND